MKSSEGSQSTVDEWGSGGRRATTLADVARHAGVSRAAASRALLNQKDVSEKTRQRVLAAASELGYVANAMAQGLATNRSHRIGLLIRNSSNPVYGAMHTALQRQADNVDMSIVAMTVTEPDVRAKERRALAALISLQVDGLIVCSGSMPSEDVEPFATRLPIISLARPEDSPRVSAISYDEADSGEQLADHLADLGHRRVAVFTVDEIDSLSLFVRTSAMVSRLQQRGVQVVTIPSPSNPAQIPLKRELLAPILDDDRITALMCPHDAMMVQCLELLAELRIDVPSRLSVTGCDGIGILGSSYLGFTTYSLPIDETAKRGINLMHRLTDTPNGPYPTSIVHESVKGKLVIGRTTAAPLFLS